MQTGVQQATRRRIVASLHMEKPQALISAYVGFVMIYSGVGCIVMFLSMMLAIALQCTCSGPSAAESALRGQDKIYSYKDYSHSHSCLLLRWRFSATRDDRWTLVILVRGIVCRNKNWGSPGRWCCYVTSQTEVHLKMCPRGWARPEGSLSFLFFHQFFFPFQTPKKNLF